LAKGDGIAIAYIDLDNFKAVNDRFGHDAGDRLLRSVAGIINSSVRKGDAVARLGGDEFAVLMPAIGDRQIRRRFAGMLQRMRGHFRSRRLKVTASVGVFVYRIPPSSVDVMIRDADRQMYAAKRAGKDMIVFGSQNSARDRKVRTEKHERG